MNEKQYVASLSYGKDSMAMLHVITDVLHWPLDRIITADVWATDTIPAELPPMVEFKAYADEEIKKRWGIEVEHYRANITYEEGIYHKINEKTLEKRKAKGQKGSKYNYYNNRTTWGFPTVMGAWCNSKLKMAAIEKSRKATKDAVQYVGIASDEPIRIERHSKNGNVKMPLVEAKWTERMCREWCENNGLLSPIYATSSRGGCWFCHNQGINQLRLLRENYPDLWALLLKWDNDSPVTFHPDGHTVHDFDERFQWEDEGFWPESKHFKWQDIENPQYNFEQIIRKETNNGN